MKKYLTRRKGIVSFVVASMLLLTYLLNVFLPVFAGGFPNEGYGVSADGKYFSVGMKNRLGMVTSDESRQVVEDFAFCIASGKKIPFINEEDDQPNGVFDQIRNLNADTNYTLLQENHTYSALAKSKEDYWDRFTKLIYMYLADPTGVIKECWGDDLNTARTEFYNVIQNEIWFVTDGHNVHPQGNSYLFYKYSEAQRNAVYKIRADLPNIKVPYNEMEFRGYKPHFVSGAGYQALVTGRFKDEPADITVKKEWQNVSAGTKTPDVYIQLLRNGNPEGDPKQLENNQTKFTIPMKKTLNQYSVKEVDKNGNNWAVDGYEAGEVQKINEQEYKIVNKKTKVEPGIVKVNKVWRGQVDPAARPDVYFQLMQNGKPVQDQLKKWEGPDVEFNIKDKDSIASYSVKEVKADGKRWSEPGYDEPIVTKKADGLFEFVNRKSDGKTHEISILKVQEDGHTPLKGAKLAIKRLFADGGGERVGTAWDSDENSKKLKLGVGEYQLEELAPPTGYALATPITFRISEDGKVSIKENDSFVEQNNTTVKLINKKAEPKKYSVKIQKVTGDGAKQEALPGARLQVLQNGVQKAIWNSLFAPTELKLEPGQYTLKELKAPEGYGKLAKDIAFTVAENGRIFSTTTGTMYTINGDLITVRNESVPYIGTIATIKKNQEASGKRISIKKGSEDSTKLAVGDEVSYSGFDDGSYVALATLIKKHDEKQIVSKNSKEFTVADGKSKGVVEVELSFKKEDLELGENEFTVLEEVYRKQDVVDGKPKEGTTPVATHKDVNDEQQTVIVDYVPNNFVFNFYKIDQDGKALAGARLKITTDKGEDVRGMVWTSLSQRPTPVYLSAGSYILKEIVTPQGFTKLKDTPFTVSEKGEIQFEENALITTERKSEVTSVKVTNKKAIKPANITVTKKWENVKQGADKPEVWIQLFKDGKPEGDKKLIEPDKNQITFEIPNKDEIGKYSVKEVDKNGDDWKHEGFTAGQPVNNGNGHFEITNTRNKKPGIVKVQKLWKNLNGEQKPDVYFQLLKDDQLIGKPKKWDNQDLTFDIDDKDEMAQYSIKEVTQDGKDWADPAFEQPIIEKVVDGFKVTNTKKGTPKTKVTFKKIAGDTNKDLAGAHLVLKRILDDGRELPIKDWDTNGQSVDIDLDAGSYVLTEEKAPDGYMLAAPVSFYVEEDGQIILIKGEDFEKQDDKTITMVDEKIKEKPTKPSGKLATTVEVDGTKAAAKKELELSVVTDKVTKTVKDTVVYENLVAGEKYKLTGRLMKIEGDQETEVSKSEVTFNAKAGTNSETVTFTNVELESGKKYVVYETAESEREIDFKEGKGKHKVEHKNKNDKAQTVVVTKTKPTKSSGKLATTVEVDGTKATAQKELELSVATDKVMKTVKDTVMYENLVAGEKYKLTGRLMKIEGDQETEVSKSEVTFNAKAGTNSETVTFTNVELESGKKYVVYETAESEREIDFKEGKGKHKVEHKNKNDKAQTVVVSKTKPGAQEVRFSKINVGGEEIAGAKIQIKQGNTVVANWISEADKTHTLTLKPGDYIFHEEAAPDGYLAVTDIHFSVDKTGQVTVTNVNGNTAVAKGNKLTVTDKTKPVTPPSPEEPSEPGAQEVHFSKINVGGEEIAGAEIQIKQGNTVVANWISEADKTHTLTLKPGDYIFHEEAAPDGYLAVTDIHFSVDKTGQVTVTDVNGNTAVAEGNKLTVTDQTKPVTPPSPEEPSEPGAQEVHFSKINVGGEEIAGAKIQIKQGNTVVANWISEADKTHTLTLKPGHYIFHEEVAPDGYLAVTDIHFSVDKTGQVTVTNVNGNTAVAKGNKLTVTDQSTDKDKQDKLPNSGETTGTYLSILGMITAVFAGLLYRSKKK